MLKLYFLISDNNKNNNNYYYISHNKSINKPKSTEKVAVIVNKDSREALSESISGVKLVIGAAPALPLFGTLGESFTY